MEKGDLARIRPEALKSPDMLSALSELKAQVPAEFRGDFDLYVLTVAKASGRYADVYIDRPGMRKPVRLPAYALYETDAYGTPAEEFALSLDARRPDGAPVAYDRTLCVAASRQKAYDAEDILLERLKKESKARGLSFAVRLKSRLGVPDGRAFVLVADGEIKR